MVIKNKFIERYIRNTLGYKYNGLENKIKVKIMNYEFYISVNYII